MHRIILILFLMCQFGFAASKEYNVMDFGAKADGKRLILPLSMPPSVRQRKTEEAEYFCQQGNTCVAASE